MKMKKYIVVIYAVIASLLCLSNAFAVDNPLYASFQSNGIWKWTGSGWTQLTPDSPEGMVAAGEKLYGDFGSNGLWQWGGSGWSKLTPDNPAMMVASGNDLYGTFTGSGI